MLKLKRIVLHLFRRFILNRPKTVRILAAGPATRRFCPADHDAELWSLNRFWRTDWLPREPDRWFEIHQPVVHDLEQNEEDEKEDRKHSIWLKKEHDFPIYFLQEAEKYPSGVPYPIEHVAPEFDWYLSSSIAYMMALAIHEGFDRIELYGCEMPQGSDYFWQRPGMMYLIGRAEGEFIDIYTPPGSTLKSEPMYAYESDEVAYDNYLRRKLHTVKRHGHVMDKHYKTHTGVVQGIRGVLDNIRNNVPELMENDELKQIISVLLSHHKAEARKLEGAINVIQGKRSEIIEQLSYRNTPIGVDDLDVAVDAGGTNLEAAFEFVEKIEREEE